MKNILFALLVSAIAFAPSAEAGKKQPSKKQASKTTVSKSYRAAKASTKQSRAVARKQEAAHKARAARFPVAQVADDPHHLDLKSIAALVIDQADGRTLFSKNPDSVQPIASITKLMTAMVVLDAQLDLREGIEITDEDLDMVKHTRSRLRVGTVLTRDEMLRLALMASENRAAASLSRAYPGGSRTFVAAMNQKAADLGMTRTRFADSTGLSSDNVSTAQDLAKMVVAAHRYPLIQEYTTTPGHVVYTSTGKPLAFNNSNGLVKDSTWHIDVSKTGYISEAGRCLVMQARIAARPVVIVLLDSWGRYTRIGDANRIKRWMEASLSQPPG